MGKNGVFYRELGEKQKEKKGKRKWEKENRGKEKKRKWVKRSKEGKEAKGER